ncbi:hypothetical protein GIB67_041413 [Kingdonia uniflora]|uniref:nucleoside-diphosphate kinase n=1 Tax=Kingdonia uniflora TaxID=39325 RepID=A0A7J7LRQ4_9MAGN|nr:hypothetical protein GIB67_041413 [Kingdonia uniflora]
MIRFLRDRYRGTHEAQIRFIGDLTVVTMKPDGVQRNLVDEIIDRFEKKGFTLKGLKLMNADHAFAEKHYEDLSKKPVEYILWLL